MKILQELLSNFTKDVPPDDHPVELTATDDDHPELDGIAADAVNDSNKMGLIRTVPGAHLVFKRQSNGGTFTELWMYNNVEFKKAIEIKKLILAGTDIKPKSQVSDDGEQTYELWGAGNVEFLLITGLPG